MTDLERRLRDALATKTDAAAPAAGLPEAALRAGRRARRARTGLAAAASLVLVALLALPLVVQPPLSGVPAAPVTTAGVTTPAPPATAPTDLPAPTLASLPPLTEDAARAHAAAFIAFARDPENSPVAGLGLADRVLLGVGGELTEQVPQNRLATQAGWDTGDASTAHAERSGPFNAITTLRDHAARAEAAAFDTRMVVDYPSCNNPQEHVAAPPSLADHVRVTIQPAADSVDSCIDWFAVDLYLSPDDRVAGVVLVLGSP
ncbi:hypothetical protein [Propioniciclava sp.]|uniref:hypothetical protein n=1 Tax=Propioniciclava sp. TaxID=2038686 RepID=UPI002610CDB9|nr:hypothetical protein [Propioniciclava sp.]